ncbi:MAG: metallophosphoesterase [Candidatus Magnetominusculus sp. LBB02]|nr:metallophosphoesterase [Candidatus Magnetominusculus sp. LBB02]
MLIGVIADSHDNIAAIAKAVALFNISNISYVLHAGDFSSTAALEALKDLNAQFIGVFGNNDGGIATYDGAGPLSLETHARGFIYRQPHEFIIDGKRFIMIHEHFDVEAIAGSGRCDVLIYGHTHRASATVIGKTYVLNPGELCGWLHGSATAAIFDTRSMKARIIKLD